MKRKTLCKVLAITLVLGLLAAVGAMAEEETISGTVMKNDQGAIILSADDGQDYLVKGQDLSGMVGKQVNVTGTLQEAAGGKSITVTNFEEVSQ